MKEKMIIEGYAIVYNTKTFLYEYGSVKYYEVIDPRALNNCDISNVSLRYNHSDQVFIAAATRNKTLQLTNDSKGLKVNAELVNTSAGRDLYEMVKTGLINKMSFAFYVGIDEWDVQKKQVTRIVKEIRKLVDVSCVDFPAYPTTSVYALDETRSKDLQEMNEIRKKIKEGELNFEKERFKRQSEQKELDFIKQSIKNKYKA